MAEASKVDERTADWNPREPEALNNQTRTLDAMRERCPVAYSDFFGWSLFRYEDVVKVSRDPATFSSGPGSLEELEALKAKGKTPPGIPLRLDPPAHTSYRAMLNPYFSFPRMKAFEPRSRATAVRILTPLIASGAGDIVENFADPYPIMSLCALLGWNEDDWRQLKNWTVQKDRSLYNHDEELLKRVLDEWHPYIMKVVEERRREPREDVTSWLLQQTKEGAPLDDRILTSILQLLLQAGHASTTASISLVLYHLATDQQLQNRLRAEPALVPRAIEEILRVDGPLVGMPRQVKKDVVINGRTLCAGETLHMMYMSANRDPAAFANADTIDIDRKDNRHIIWGTGIHACLGMPLAKLELKIAVEELLARTASFRLQEGAELRRLRYPGNAHKALPCVFEARQ